MTVTCKWNPPQMVLIVTAVTLAICVSPWWLLLLLVHIDVK